MKKSLIIGGILLGFIAGTWLFPAVGGGTGTLNQLSQWTVSGGDVKLASTTANVRIPSLPSEDCIGTDATGVLQSGTCTGGGGSGSVGTSSVPTISNLSYWTTSGEDIELLGSVATTTATIGSGLSYSGTFGALVGGASGTLTLDATGDWTGTFQGANSPDFLSATTTDTAEGLITFTEGLTSNATTTIAGNSVVGDWTGATYDAWIYSSNNASSSVLKLGNNRLEGTLAGTIGNIDFTDTGVTKMISVPSSEVYYAWMNADNEVRFAIPEPGTDKGTYNPRSLIVAGPWTDDADFIKCSFWGFWAIDCNTGGTGADLGVQDDIQVLGDTFIGGALTASSTANLGVVSAGTWNGTAIDFSDYTNATADTGIKFTDDAIGFDCSEVEGTGINCVGEAVTLDTTGDWTGTFDGQEGSYYLDATNLTNFGIPFYTYFNATTTDALSEGATNLYFTDDRVATVIAGTTTDALSEGSTNFYATQSRWDSFWNASTTLASVTSIPNLATVGALNSGSITSGFGNIDNGASTIDTTGAVSFGNTTVNTGATLTVTDLTSALTLTGAGGAFAEYTGTTCTNQFVRALSALGVATCATVDISADTNLAVSSPIVLTDDTLSFDFTTTNTWANLQTFSSGINVNSETFTDLTGNGLSLVGGALTVATSTFNLDPSSIDLTTGYTLMGDSSNNAIATSSLFIAANGDVGISSTSPMSLLGVAGTTTTQTLNIDNPNHIGTSTMYIYSGTAGFGGEVILENNDGAGCTSITTNSSNQVLGVSVTCPEVPVAN